MTLQAVLPCNSYHIIDHGTSWLHTSVWSLHFLHHLGPAALGSVHVNHIETCTSMCNIYMYTVCLSPQSHAILAVTVTLATKSEHLYH